MAQSKPKKKISLMYWLAFIVATIAITKFFGGYTYFDDSTVFGFVMNGVWLAIFALTMVYMIYRIYSDERANDNLIKSYAPFEPGGMVYKIFNWRSKES